MRIWRAAVLAVAAFSVVSCSSGGLFRQYEYEEDIYLALDGTATVYVNSSVAALDALRGASLDIPPVGAGRSRRRPGVLYVAGDARDAGQPVAAQRPALRARAPRCGRHPALSAAGPFQWSRYDFRRQDDLYLYLQTLGAAAKKRRRRRGLDGRRDRRVPAAPAEQDRVPQRGASRTSSAGTSWSGSSRWPTACRARRSCSTRACRRSRFSTGR